MPELQDPGMLLVSLDPEDSQVEALEGITPEAERQLQGLRSEYDLSGTRRAVFEAFADDMYMYSSVEMAIWDRQWFQQDALHIVTDAMGEINGLLTEEQLQRAGNLMDRVPRMGPPGDSWPESPKGAGYTGR